MISVHGSQVRECLGGLRGGLDILVVCTDAPAQKLGSPYVNPEPII